MLNEPCFTGRYGADPFVAEHGLANAPRRAINGHALNLSRQSRASASIGEARGSQAMRPGLSEGRLIRARSLWLETGSLEATAFALSTDPGGGSPVLTARPYARLDHTANRYGQRRISPICLPNRREVQRCRPQLHRFARLGESQHIVGLRLALLRPGAHKLSPLVKDIRPAVGPVQPESRPDVPSPARSRHGERRDLLRPRPEGCSESVSRNPPAARGINPLLVGARVHSLEKCQQGHVGQWLAAGLPREDET